MGNKIITEKDFWMCTGGNMPAPLQVQQKRAKKKSGEKFATKVDTSTSSIIDFGCKKLMWIMAILAAVLAVCVVATGGAALIAIAAMAGAAGAAYGAVLGGLICGQIAAMARMWLESKDKPNKGFYILNQPAITGNHKMKCRLFGDEISFAPEVKNWWQALAIGGANLITGIMEGMMYGAMVGMGGAAVGGVRTLISQGGVQLSRQAGLNFLKTNSINILKNVGTGVFGDWGMKVADGSVGFLNKYGYTGSANASDFTDAVKESAMGDINAIKNVFSGNGSSDDFMALAMLLVPGDGPSKNKDAPIHADSNTPTKTDGSDASSTNKDADDGTVHKSHALETDTPSKKKDGEAYEADVKKNSKPEWLIRLEEGREFDKEQSVNYDYNQVYVKKPDGKGYYILDSYKPGQEIVSRKNTQLSDVKKDTAKSYIDEINKKYPEGAEIADVNSNNVGGGNEGIFDNGNTLRGDKILEIPVQNKPIPQSVIDIANNADVTIRDVNGTIYNP